MFNQLKIRLEDRQHGYEAIVIDSGPLEGSEIGYLKGYPLGGTATGEIQYVISDLIDDDKVLHRAHSINRILDLCMAEAYLYQANMTKT